MVYNAVHQDGSVFVYSYISAKVHWCICTVFRVVHCCIVARWVGDKDGIEGYLVGETRAAAVGLSRNEDENSQPFPRWEISQ